jgi:hypothetical protein
MTTSNRQYKLGIENAYNKGSQEGYEKGKKETLEAVKIKIGYMAEVICALNKFKYLCYSEVSQGIDMDWLMKNAPCNINDSNILCGILKEYYPEIYQESGKSIRQMEEELKQKLKEVSK